MDDFILGTVFGIILMGVYYSICCGFRLSTKKTICVSCGKDVNHWNIDRYVGTLCKSCTEYIEET